VKKEKPSQRVASKKEIMMNLARGNVEKNPGPVTIEVEE